MARPGLSKHRKFKRLVKMLGEPMPHVRGYLELLWEVGYENGDPFIGDASDVALSCEFPGRPKRITDALLRCGGEGRAGFIEEAESHPGKYQIHDLFHHAPEYVLKRLKRENERQKRGGSNDNDLEPICPDNVHRPAENGAPPAPAPAPVLITPAVAGNAEGVSAPPTSPIKVTPRKEPTGDHPTLVEYFRARWQRQYGKEYVVQAKDGVALAKVLKAAGTLDRAREMVNRYLASGDKFLVENSHSATMLLNQINRFTAPTGTAGGNGTNGSKGTVRVDF